MNVITPLELKAQLATANNLVLIDVREPHEHEEFNIGGTNIPLGLLSQHADEIRQLSETGTIVVYCASGNRSAMGQKILEMQFQIHPVFNMAGGVKRWKEELE
jgi:rhodanese-related sulfurtransferase